MATYYIRQSGDDANDGLSPETAWRTTRKGFSSAVGEGDTVYIGAGIYRDSAYPLAMSGTTGYQFIGDIHGIYTGDAGEVILEQADSPIRKYPASNQPFWSSSNSKNGLTFRYIKFKTSSSGGISISGTSTNWQFFNCHFETGGTGQNILVTIICSADTQYNHIFDGCVFINQQSANHVIQITIATSSISDYDVNIKIRNCIYVVTALYGVIIPTSGGSQFKGGGGYMTNCSYFGPQRLILINSSNVSSDFYSFVKNCFFYSSASTEGARATRIGQLFENFNEFHTSLPRANVPIGHQTSSDGSRQSLFEFNFNRINNEKNMFFLPQIGSPMLWGGDLSQAEPTDILGNIRPLGNFHLINDGTIINSTGNNMTIPEILNPGITRDRMIKILDGNGAGQTKLINTNTGDTITVNGEWPIQPNSGSKYCIYDGIISQYSKVSTGSSYTITDNYADFPINAWFGFTMRITSGNAAGQQFIISGNDSNTISGFSSLSPVPNSGNIYEIFFGGIYTGIVSTGTTGSITDNNANWSSEMWWGNYVCMITSGAASGQSFAIASGNTFNTVSGYTSFTTAPQSGDTYAIYSHLIPATGKMASGYIPPYSREYISCAVGCYERPNTAIKSTNVVLSGSNSLRLFGGPSCQDFKVPVVGNAINNIAIYGYYDKYYSGTNPQLIIKDCEYLGINSITGTMVGSSGQWEKITTSFTPSGNGVVTARLMSNCSNIGGSAYFDSFIIY